MKRLIPLIIFLFSFYSVIPNFLEAKGGRGGGRGSRSGSYKSISPRSSGKTYIKGYYRKDGTYVRGHYRGLPKRDSTGSYGYPSKRSYSSLPSSTKYSPGIQQRVEGRRIKAIDGDTFLARGQKIRIHGIDTPERGQPGFYAAKSRLQDLLNSGNVTIVLVGKDKYGRTAAKVYVNGVDVAETLKSEGYGKSH